MRLKGLLAAAVAGGLALSQAIGISPAQAEAHQMACNYDYVTFNACLTFYDIPGSYEYRRAVAGLDYFVPQRYAQEIINYGGAFRASVYGDDNGTGRWLANLNLSPGWPGAGSDGLSVEFTADLSQYTTLNEDPEGGEDELYVEITFFDYHINDWVRKRTGIVHGYFDPPGSGPGCLVAC